MAKTTGEDTAAPTARLLRRRVGNRVIGGVAGGLGDYFQIDPLLLRIGFVGLMIFGGAGLVLYVIAWLLIPSEGQDRSTIEGLIYRMSQMPFRFVWIAVALLAVILLLGPFRGEDLTFGSGPFGIPGSIWAVVVIVGGVALLRRRDSGPAAVAGPAATAHVPGPAERPVPRPRSPLPWYTIGACFLVIGILAAATRISGIEITPGQHFGAVMLTLGAALIVGSWWGRARVLLLFVILLSPFAVVASYLTAPLEGGVGSVQVAPVTVAELRSEYRLMAGELDLDLTQLAAGPHEYSISASVGAGQLVVILPEGASLEIHSQVGAGTLTVLGPTDVGTRLDGLWVRHHLRHTTYILDLEVGIGEILVISRSPDGIS